VKLDNLPQELNVKNVKELHEALKEAISSEPKVILDFSNIRRLDLSAVQVIMAAGKEAAAKSKVLKIKSISDNLLKQLNICGIEKKLR